MATRKIKNDYVIAIPSYNRPNDILKKTLSVLRHYRISNSKIHIFLHSNEQKKLYEETIPKEFYGKLIVHNLPMGIGKVRNFIMDYFPIGKQIVSLDDDVSGYMEPVGGKLKQIKSLENIIHKGFQLCKENKFTLWGFYPVCNAFFMKGEPITKDLRFIVGGTMGFINKRKHVSLNFKEDYEYTLMCYKEDGGVIRFNRICVKHNVASSKGGIGKDQQARLDDYKKAAQNLMKRFPGLVHMNKQREGEILLRDKSEREILLRDKSN
jgi:hypothetical protein